jgi:hypothetical protein
LQYTDFQATHSSAAVYENLSPELHPNWFRTVEITDELSCRKSAHYDYQQPYCYTVVITMMMVVMEMITIILWKEHLDQN